MSVSFSVKNVPDGVARALRARAKRNHRSLQGELMTVLEAAARAPSAGAATASPAPPSEVRETAIAFGPELRSSAAPTPPPPPQSDAKAAASPFLIDRRELAVLCRRHHIRRLSLFGSALRPDFHPGSDVDLLVEFDRKYPVGLRIVDVEQELSALAGGRKVDLVNPKYLNARLRPGILASAQVLYAEG